LAEAVESQLERAQGILDLLSAEEWVTSRTIANLVGQSPKSAKLYIKALRNIGHEIESARGKGYRLEGRLGEGRLLLSEDEMLALFLSLERCSKDFSADLLDRLRRRLLNLLSQGRRQQALSLETPKDETSRAFFENLDSVKAISKARESGRLLRLTYHGLKDQQPRRRTVQPIRFVPGRDAWYLEVWDVEDHREKSFRLDRIRDAVCLNEKGGTRPKGLSIDHHPWDFGEEAIDARLKVRPDLARWLAENPSHPSQRLTSLPCGSHLAEYRIRCQGKFLDWLMGLRGFELQGPEALVASLRERAQTLFQSQGTFSVPWEVSAR
jgi:predicted DNA-binding transcriptional regulator YafY